MWNGNNDIGLIQLSCGTQNDSHHYKGNKSCYSSKHCFKSRYYRYFIVLIIRGKKILRNLL